MAVMKDSIEKARQLSIRLGKKKPAKWDNLLLGLN